MSRRATVLAFAPLSLLLLVIACGEVPEESTPPSGPFTITVALAGDGSGVVTSAPVGIDCGSTCSYEFAEGTTVVLTATASTGSSFDGWSGPGCSGTDPCEVTLNTDSAFTATFVASGDGGGNGGGDGGTPIVVTSNSAETGGEECSLRDAITAANTDTEVAGCAAGSGADTIQLPSGVTISLVVVDNSNDGPNGLPSVVSEISIEGNGTVIERASDTEFRIFHLGAAGELTLENLTVRHGHGGDFGGGGIFVGGGALSLLNVTVEDNLANLDALGAAILSEAGSVEVRESTFQGNADPDDADGDDLLDQSGGAIAVRDGQLGIFDSTIMGNGPEGWNVPDPIVNLIGTTTADIADSIISENSGMAIRNEGTLTVSNVELRENWNEDAGGVLNLGDASFDNVQISGTKSEVHPGLENRGTATATLANSKVFDNAGEFGGMGIRNSGTMNIADSEIYDNVSNEPGGGIANHGEMTISGSIIRDNFAPAGGGIANEGTLTLSDTIIGGDTGNTAGSDGGGIYVPAGVVGASVSLIDGSSIVGNEAGGNGGGIYADSPLELTLCETCTITGNTAGTSGPGDGGGLYASSVTTTSLYGPGIFDNSPDQVAPGGSVDIRVTASADDAEEFVEPVPSEGVTPGTVIIDSNDLEFTYDVSRGTDQVVGVRFDSVALPSDAIVLDARIVFTASHSDAGATAIEIAVEDAANAEAFQAGQATNEISSRTTSGAVAWEPEGWATVDESGPKQATPGLGVLLEDVITRGDWSSGNAVVFVFEAQTPPQGAGATRSAYSYDGDAGKAPRLVVHYLMPN